MILHFADVLLNFCNRYKENVSKIKELVQDEPTSGLERAVWWTEYVIRNKGAPYFKNRAVDMPWTQYFLLDVFFFLLSVMLVVIYISRMLVKFLISVFWRIRRVKTKVL